MGQLIVEDTINVWPVLAAGLAIAALCSLIIIAIMRWVAGPVVWLSIIGVLALLGAGKSLIHIHFIVILSNCNNFNKTLLNLTILIFG